MPPRPFDRDHMVRELRRAADRQRPPFDLVVIGAGITGAGIALDAAARGLRTALVDRGDFAAGTSSKSSKMVHGGLRYLQNGEIRLVYEALRERRRVMRNAPHLVEVLPFLIPIMTRDGVVKKRIARALGSAMWMYDLTGGWRIGRLHRRISAARSAEHFPTCHTDQLSAGYLYYDASADDARLTLTVALTAAQRGAVVANHLPVVGLERPEVGHVHGVTVQDGEHRFAVPARAVVDATGVWSDELRTLEAADAPVQIRPAKGVHLVVPWKKVRNDVAVVIPSRRDRRSVFLMPWGANGDGTFRHTYVGTTDTDHHGDLEDPTCDATDIEYLLAALNAALTEPIEAADVTGVWAGLRPLVRESGGGHGATADLSRRHVIATGPGGVIHVNGGKLTTYRAMAQDAVDAVVEALAGSPRAWKRHVTRRLRLAGAASPLRQAHGDPHLTHRFGSAAGEVAGLAEADPELARPLVEGQPYLRAEVVYAVRAEMARHLDDVLLRRTRAHLFDRAATVAAAPDAADLMAAELGWSAAERDAELARYRRICHDEEEACRHHAWISNPTD